MHDQTKPIAVNEYPSKRHVAARGALLGIASGLIGNGLSALVYILKVYIAMDLSDYAGGQADPPAVAVLMLIGSCAITVPVGGLAGIFLAIGMRWYGTVRELTSRIGALFGAIAGFLCATTFKVFLVCLVWQDDNLSPIDPSLLLPGAIYAVAGAWHGWQMARWLARARI